MNVGSVVYPVHTDARMGTDSDDGWLPRYQKRHDSSGGAQGYEWTARPSVLPGWALFYGSGLFGSATIELRSRPSG